MNKGSCDALACAAGEIHGLSPWRLVDYWAWTRESDLDDYAVDLGSDEFLSDIPAGARAANGISPPFANKTADNGVADADDVSLTAVSGDQSEAIVIYKDTGDETTSPLLAFIDTAAGLPVTPSGGDVAIAWDNGPDRIFRI